MHEKTHSTLNKKQQSVRKKTSGKTFSILRKTFLDFLKSLSEGADKLANICIDKNQDKKSNKGEDLKKETTILFKELATGTKQNLKGIHLQDVICDTSYEIGRFSRKTKNTGRKIFRKLLK